MARAVPLHPLMPRAFASHEAVLLPALRQAGATITRHRHGLVVAKGETTLSLHFASTSSTRRRADLLTIADAQGDAVLTVNAGIPPRTLLRDLQLLLAEPP